MSPHQTVPGWEWQLPELLPDCLSFQGFHIEIVGFCWHDEEHDNCNISLVNLHDKKWRAIENKKIWYRVSQPTLGISHRKRQTHFGFPGRLRSCSSCYKWSLVKSEIKTEMSHSFNLGNQIFLSSHGLKKPGFGWTAEKKKSYTLSHLTQTVLAQRSECLVYWLSYA